jgi:phosphoglycolate phosphatase-like HAD superfamily hydrolase
MMDTTGGKLVLFDIDGTILYTGGAGRRAMHRSLLEIFGATGPIKGFPFSGKTDPQIVKELMVLVGYAPSLIEKKLDRFWNAYVEYLRDEMNRAHGLMVYPGVVNVIEELQGRDGTLLGLQTGNIQRGARLKLEPVGLNRYFPVGAFGDDSADRNQLPRIAVERVKEQLHREFRRRDVVIIGDTTADISCARHFGAKAVVVATGFQSYQELKEAGPDAFFHDFSDYHAAVEEILT